MIPGADITWYAFPLVVKDSAPFKRNEMQIYFEERGIQTRPVFTGNILRQPGFKASRAAKARTVIRLRTSLLVAGSLSVATRA